MFFKWLEKVISHINSFLFFMATLLAFVQVLSRYVFNSSLSWSEELLRYLFIWMFFLASALCIKDNQHVALDIFIDYLKPKWKRLVKTIVNGVLILFLVFLSIYGSIFAFKNMSQLSTALRFPIGVVNAAIPIGSVLMIIYLIRQIYLRYTNIGKEDD